MTVWISCGPGINGVWAHWTSPVLCDTEPTRKPRSKPPWLAPATPLHHADYRAHPLALPSLLHCDHSDFALLHFFRRSSNHHSIVQVIAHIHRVALGLFPGVAESHASPLWLPPLHSIMQVIAHIHRVAVGLFPGVAEAKYAEWWAHCRPHGSGHQV